MHGVAHALQVLKEDSKFIFKAAAEAQKAADYI
jgi:antirestriction protein ArdC